MSGWDAYIKTLLESNACIKKAAIVSNTDGSLWAKSDGAQYGQNFAATDAELRTLTSQFNTINNIPQEGIVLENTKYFVPFVEDALVFGKKDKHGVFAVKTNQALVIAIFDGDHMECQSCRTAVERIAQYLRDASY